MIELYCFHISDWSSDLWLWKWHQLAQWLHDRPDQTFQYHTTESHCFIFLLLTLRYVPTRSSHEWLVAVSQWSQQWTLFMVHHNTMIKENEKLTDPASIWGSSLNCCCCVSTNIFCLEWTVSSATHVMWNRISRVLAGKGKSLINSENKVTLHFMLVSTQCQCKLFSNSIIIPAWYLTYLQSQQAKLDFFLDPKY